MFWLRNKKIKFSLRTLNSCPELLHQKSPLAKKELIEDLIRQAYKATVLPAKSDSDVMFCFVYKCLVKH